MSYVKPYVKRGKTDQADAEAICESVTRPTASALAATTPEVDNFRTARDHAAWLGLTPRPPERRQRGIPA